MSEYFEVLYIIPATEAERTSWIHATEDALDEKCNLPTSEAPPNWIETCRQDVMQAVDILSWIIINQDNQVSVMVEVASEGEAQ